MDCKYNLENLKESGCERIGNNVDISIPEVSDAEYYNVDDIADIDELLFTKQVAKQIMLYEKTVELIGIIGQTEIRSNVMKFTLQNKTDDVIQVLVSSPEIIKKIKSMIMPGKILLIDGAFAKHRSESLSAGNCSRIIRLRIKYVSPSTV
ncbi:uncharacterized protein LOC107981088 [Nasonia vitripennis]|uniref:Uncharacterized protein n=1 Tax=Nasonia vitripennis TaxID=7425 RepID=A0A7M7R1T7_NASVI|nr:uncharacterized protein LOC107981088 [Nasonia vitripennis]